MSFKNWRKVATWLHRDLGYFFVGMVIIYTISGIALNHRNDWNPSLVVVHQTIETGFTLDQANITQDSIVQCLDDNHVADPYRGHDFPSTYKLKVFTKKGSMLVDLETGTGEYEALKKRPLFYQFNFLHTTSKRAWIWFSDIFCIGLLIITITGIVMRKGRHGIRGRGGWLIAAGVILPIIFLYALS